MLVEGMYAEKSPPPRPLRKPIIMNVDQDVLRSCTAKPSQIIGNILMMVVMLTTGLVPKIGMKKEYINLNMPDANPGMAASQKSSMVVNLNPIAGRRTTTALMTNHVANEKRRENVVTPHVRHAIALPVSFQNCGSSGSHLGNLAIASHSFFPKKSGR